MNGPDLATAKLAAELQLEDIEQVLGGIGAAGTGDEYAAFTAMKTTFENIIQGYEDQLAALNLLRLEYTTRIECERIVSEERQALRDHDLARELGGLDACHNNCLPSRSGSIVEEEMDLRGDNVIVPSVFPDTTASSREQVLGLQIDIQPPFSVEKNCKGGKIGISTPMFQEYTSATPGPSKGKRKAVSQFEDEEDLARPTHGHCSACMERCPRFDLVELTCKREGDTLCHCYCRGCLIDLFKASLTDTTLFPPRCCGQRIPLFAGAHFFSPELIKQYEEKEAELATPNPVYCSNHFCGQFIKPHNMTADVATCPACDSKTCTVCKNPSHKGLCPEDPTVQLLMDVAGQKKWQRCYNCRTMVELLMGCYHMRCRCGSEFCYLCAKPWKTCSCSQWDENRLLNNGSVIDGAHQHHIAMPEEEEVPEANAAADVLNELNLRLATVAGGYRIDGENREPDDESNASVVATVGCAHRWQRTYGRRGDLEACGICHFHLKFLNHCGACNTQVCNRCLNNRL